MQSLVVPPNKVNLAERDIEDWLYENPSEIALPYGRISQWIARQYSMPSGIADLIGIMERIDGLPETLVVVEVKNVEIGKAAILQVCRYAMDLKQIMSRRMDSPRWADGEPVVSSVIVGPSIDSQTFYEAMSCRVSIVRFSVSMQLELNHTSWSREHRDEIDSAYDRIAHQPEWNRYGDHIDDRVEQIIEGAARADELDDELSETLGSI